MHISMIINIYCLKLAMQLANLAVCIVVKLTVAIGLVHESNRKSNFNLLIY